MFEIWMIFALLAPAFFAVCNIIDKFVLSKSIKNPYIYVILFTSIETCFAFLILLIGKVEFTYPYFIFGIFCGLAAFIAYVLYSKAMIVEEASRVVPLIYITSLITVILAAIFLNEILVFEKYIGIALLLIGVFMISYEKPKEKIIGFSPALKFMLLFALIYGFVGIFEKFILNYISYWSLVFSISIGSFLGVLSMLLIQKFRSEFFNTIPKIGIKVFLIVVISEVFYYLGIISFLIATQIAPVSLTSTLSSIQPFFVLIYTTILSIFAPQIIKEEIGKVMLLRKFISIMLILIGIFFIGV
jgi:drug/metabolite transporter (DMT)-like permease